MKKVIFALSVVALIGASSCKKSYTCTCTVTGNSGGYAVTNEEIPSTTKSNATSACSTYQTAEQDGVTAANAGSGLASGTVSCSI